MVEEAAATDAQELRFVPMRESDVLVMALYYDQQLKSKADFVFNIVLVLENNSVLNFESSNILNDKFVLTNLKNLMNDLQIEND